MDKEEKKAIENLKEINQAIKYRPMFSIPSDTKLFDTILNLIEKQSKEIEELKEDNKHQWEERCKLTFELKNSTSNDKIKAKIEELERDKNKLYKEQGNIEEIKIYSVIDIIKAEILRFKELLEKE